jgi:hypothetical protein
MSADLPRDVIMQWTNDQGLDEEAIVPVYGHSDFDLAQWAAAFKAQHADTIKDARGARDLCAYIELDLN